MRLSRIITTSWLLSAFLLHADEPAALSNSSQAGLSVKNQKLIDDAARAIAAKAGLGVDSELYRKLRLTLQKSLVDKTGTYNFSIGLEGGLNKTDTSTLNDDKQKIERALGLDYGVTAGIDYNITNVHALEASLFLGKGTRIYQKDFNPFNLGVRDVHISYSSIKTGFDLDYKYRLSSFVQLSAGMGFRKSNFTADSTAYDKQPLGFIKYYDDSVANHNKLPAHFTARNFLEADRLLQQQIGKNWSSGTRARKAAAKILLAVAEGISNVAGIRDVDRKISNNQTPIQRQADSGAIIKDSSSSDTLGALEYKINNTTQISSSTPSQQNQTISGTSITCDYAQNKQNQICRNNPSLQDIYNSLDTFQYVAQEATAMLAKSGFNPDLLYNFQAKNDGKSIGSYAGTLNLAVRQIANLKKDLVSVTKDGTTYITQAGLNGNSQNNAVNNFRNLAYGLSEIAREAYNNTAGVSHQVITIPKLSNDPNPPKINRVRATTTRKSYSQIALQPQVGISYLINNTSEVYARYKVDFNSSQGLETVSSPQYVTLGYRYHF